MKRHAGQHPRRGGMTLLELLIALAISLIFVGSVSLAFIQIIRASDEVEAVVLAHQSSRSAVDSIARDLRQLQLDYLLEYQQLVIINRNLPYGDNVDNDLDGAVDEEFFDGYDQDGDWLDQHATFNGFTERANFVGVPDYGDQGVDEDCVFSADEISFIIPAGGPLLQPNRRRVTYRIGSFDGQDNVLLRIITPNPAVSGPSPEPDIIEPVIFDCVSLEIMPWNPNSNWTSPVPETAYWAQSWDASQIFAPLVRPLHWRPPCPSGTDPCPECSDPNAMPFKLPATFLISVVVNAERQPLSEISGWPLGGRSLKTVRMNTIVNVESVIIGTDYETYLRGVCNTPGCDCP